MVCTIVNGRTKFPYFTRSRLSESRIWGHLTRSTSSAFSALHLEAAEAPSRRVASSDLSSIGRAGVERDSSACLSRRESASFTCGRACEGWGRENLQQSVAWSVSSGIRARTWCILWVYHWGSWWRIPYLLPQRVPLPLSPLPDHNLFLQLGLGHGRGLGARVRALGRRRLNRCLGFRRLQAAPFQLVLSQKVNFSGFLDQGYFGRCLDVLFW